MAEEVKNVTEQEAPRVATDESSETAEVKDRGLFDFMGKKDEAKPEESIATEFDHKVQVSEPVPEKKHEEEEEKKPSLLEKLHRTSSSSSSSSEEEGENGEKRKKKKDKKKTEGEEKGFMEKIKEKLPGQAKTPEEASAAEETAPPQNPAEKKGILEKIKEKLPGYHTKSGEEEKKEKESD
ncbi:PREDICTED: dehydrin ERD14-like [Tarenaya hassleriana]|uniref:dehydrin ERD14-like n=1 Tax=Tarenaya hassleriana TaxID=28532 RepID=UPI00053C6AFA|nr:PREDICTED: dehydrin ERD14-like [Tarenaya hassleriana]